jgi:hypothetical protein
MEPLLGEVLGLKPQRFGGIVSRTQEWLETMI